MSTATVLNMLRKYPDRYLSGEDISSKLGVSRAAIWKEMQQLRHLGYHIDALPHLGSRLADIPDKLFADEITFGLSIHNKDSS